MKTITIVLGLSRYEIIKFMYIFANVWGLSFNSQTKLKTVVMFSCFYKLDLVDHKYMM